MFKQVRCDNWSPTIIITPLSDYKIIFENIKPNPIDIFDNKKLKMHMT